MQRECVKWFRYTFPHLKKNFFAIPNGGARSGNEASIMQGEGVVPGVFDSFLAVPRRGFHGLFIEFKYGKNDLSQHQQDFKLQAQKQNYKCATCWSLDHFMREVNRYLDMHRS
jgi:hypothetical protein